MAQEGVRVEQLQAWMYRFADLVADECEHLTTLDAAIGDGDHGLNMDRGMRAVRDKLAAMSPATAEELFKLVGMTLVSNVGGASGPLFGTFFLRLGSGCGRSEVLALEVLANAVRAGVEGVVERGRPALGDKTMFDALSPALDALDVAVAAGQPPSICFFRASEAAIEGRDATVAMIAGKGRASYLGERSAGHQDPGATSSALLFAAAAAAFSGDS